MERPEGYVKLAKDQSLPLLNIARNFSGMTGTSDCIGEAYSAGQQDMLKAGFRKVEL